MATCDVNLIQNALGIQQTGPRTVIVPADPIIWSAETSYEYLTLVASADFGQTYISKKDVPAGTPLTNTAYWIPAASYNAQLAEILREIEGLAPIDHADETTKYGPATTTEYGHVSIANGLGDTRQGVAAGVSLLGTVKDNANAMGFGNHLWARVVQQSSYNTPFAPIQNRVSPQDGFSGYGYAYADIYSGNIIFDLAFKVTTTINANTPFLTTPFSHSSGTALNLGYKIIRVSSASNLIPGYELDLNEDGSLQSASNLTPNTYYIRGSAPAFGVAPSEYSLRAFHNTDEMRAKVASYFTSESGKYTYGETQPNSLYPQVSGYTDCYAYIWHTFQQAFGWQLMSLICQTGQCNGITVGEYAVNVPIDEELLEVGDIIFWSADGGDTFEHACMYLGNGKYGEATSRFEGLKIPLISTLNQQTSVHGGQTSYGDLTRTRVVKRYLI